MYSHLVLLTHFKIEYNFLQEIKKPLKEISLLVNTMSSGDANRKNVLLTLNHLTIHRDRCRNKYKTLDAIF